MSLKVCCVETNNYAGRGFDYVCALRNAVRKRITAPNRFVVLTDTPDRYKGVCDAIGAPSNAPGWWAKLSLFRKGLFDTKRALFSTLIRC